MLCRLPRGKKIHVLVSLLCSIGGFLTTFVTVVLHVNVDKTTNNSEADKSVATVAQLR